MRSKFGTALALVGVLLTGTAAAAINTQALISPTESTLGTAATTLLPVDQAVAVIPGQVQVSPGTPVQSSTASAPQASTASAPQAQATSSTVTQQSTSATSTGATPVTNQPTASVASASKSPSVVYGNPNPSKGDDDDDDDDDDDEDDEDDEEDDD